MQEHKATASVPHGSACTGEGAEQIPAENRARKPVSHLTSIRLQCPHTKTVSRWASGAVRESIGQNSGPAKHCALSHTHPPLTGQN